MSINIKLQPDGKCNNCSKVSGPNENVECYVCKVHFHVICSETNKEDQVATKTTVTNFLLNSTKSNFLFMCDVCLTKFEQNMASTDSQRVNMLESKMDVMAQQLSNINDLLMNQQQQPAPIKNKETSVSKQPDNPWFSKVNWANVKAPPTPAVLVLGKSPDDGKNKENIDLIESTIMENNIVLEDSYENKQGELCIVLDSKESRDKLNEMVTSGGNITTKTPKGLRPSISIVGLSKECSSEEVIKMLVKQNNFISKFSILNDINDHFKVNAVRPLKNDGNKFQVFASISDTLREGFRHNGDKVTLSLKSCKIYDQFHAKRCNTCQQYGHYSKDCVNESSCAKCGEAHDTRNCASVIKNCINCVKADITPHNHYTSDINCPCLKTEQERIKNKLSRNNLNWKRRQINQPV